MCSSLTPCHSAYRRRIAAPIKTPIATITPNHSGENGRPISIEPRWKNGNPAVIDATSAVTYMAAQAYNTSAPTLHSQCDLGTVLAAPRARARHLGPPLHRVLVARGGAAQRIMRILVALLVCQVA